MAEKDNKTAYDYGMEFAEGYQYYYSNNRILLVKITESNKEKLIKVDSSHFRELIRYELYSNYKMSIGVETLNTIINTMCAKARYEGEEVITYMRVALHKGNIYYDLANEYYVKISSKGYELRKKVPIHFERNEMMLPQCIPGEGEIEDIWLLKKYFNVRKKEDYLLLIVHIICAFIPSIPHHILILLGNQGSAKSTTSRMIKKIVDPSKVDISSMPRNIDDLIIQATSSYMFVLDNLNDIKKEYNGVFCQLATGGHYNKRRLYTDDESIVFPLQSNVILNGINYVTEQPDLLDRSIVVPLKTIKSKNRRTEQEIFKEFDEELPFVLNAIFKIISKAKVIHKNIKIGNLPRMADAVKWGCAIAEAMGINHNEYLEIYYRNQNNINVEILSDNTTAYILIEMMKHRKEWTGSVAKLWEQLNFIASRDGVCQYDAFFAKSPSALSRQLNQLKVNLGRVGITFDIKNTGKCKEITIKNKEFKR